MSFVGIRDYSPRDRDSVLCEPGSLFRLRVFLRPERLLDGTQSFIPEICYLLRPVWRRYAGPEQRALAPVRASAPHSAGAGVGLGQKYGLIDMQEASLLFQNIEYICPSA